MYVLVYSVVIFSLYPCLYCLVICYKKPKWMNQRLGVLEVRPSLFLLDTGSVYCLSG